MMAFSETEESFTTKANKTIEKWDVVNFETEKKQHVTLEEIPWWEQHINQELIESESLLIDIPQALAEDMQSNPDYYKPYYLDNWVIVFDKTSFDKQYWESQPADQNWVRLSPHKHSMDPWSQDFCENQRLAPINHDALAKFKQYLKPEEYIIVCTSFRAYSELGKVLLPESYQQWLIETVRNNVWSQLVESCRNQKDSWACYAVTMTNMLRNKEWVEEQYSSAYIDFCNYYDQLLNIYTSWIIPYNAEWPWSKTALVRGGDNLTCFDLIKKYGISKDMSIKYIPRSENVVKRDTTLQWLRWKDSTTIQSESKKIIEELFNLTWVKRWNNWTTIDVDVLAQNKKNAQDKKLENLWWEYLNIICNPNNSWFDFTSDFAVYGGWIDNDLGFNLSPFDFRDLIKFSLEQWKPILFGIDAYEPFFTKKEPDEASIPPIPMMYVPEQYTPKTNKEASQKRILEVEGQFTTSNHAIVGEKIISYQGKDFILCKDSGWWAHAPWRAFPWYRIMDLDYYMKITNYTIEKNTVLAFLRSRNIDQKVQQKVYNFSHAK